MDRSLSIAHLDSGLAVILDPMSHVESVVIKIWVKVGSAVEPVELNGMSHFLEHMAFKGTSKRSAYDIAKEFDSIGGAFNAYTGRESTVYYARALSSDLEKVTDIMADVILDSQFDPAEISNEKDVVLQEIARTNDEASDVVHDKFMEVAYPSQSFGRSILGTEDRVRSFTRDDLFAFTKDHYFVDNMFIVVAGKFESQAVLELLNSKFAGLKKRTEGVRKSVVSNYGGGFYSEDKDLEQLHLVWGFKGVSHADPDYYVMDILAAILGGGMSSRLFQEIREKRGLAYSIGSYSASYKDTGVFAISTGIAPDMSKLDQFFAVCVEQMQDLEKNLRQEELERVQSQTRSGMLMRLEGVSSRSEFAGVYYRYFGALVTKEQILEQVAKVTLEDVKRCMSTLISGAESNAFAIIGKSAASISKQKVAALFS